MNEDIKNALRLAKSRKTKEKAMPKELESFHNPEAGSRVRNGVMKPYDVGPDYGADVNRWREKRGAYGREEGYNPRLDPENMYTHPSEERHDPNDPQYYVDPKEYRKGVYGRGVYALSSGGRAGMSTGGDPARNYVQSLYKSFFGREADKEGADYWTKQITSGQQTPEAVANTFKSTPEAKDYASRIITDLYHSVLGKEPDQEGLNAWSGQLLNGKKSYQDIANFFADLPEAKENFVSQAYSQLLGREPDKVGKEYFTQLLQSGQATPEQVYEALQNSEEAGDYQISSFIRDEYSGLMGREPTDQELSSAFNQLKSGAINYDQFNSSLSGSPESQEYQASNFEPYQVASADGSVTTPKQPRTAYEYSKANDELIRSLPVEQQLGALLQQEGGMWVDKIIDPNTSQAVKDQALKQLEGIVNVVANRAAVGLTENNGAKKSPWRGWFDSNDPNSITNQILAPSAFSAMKIGVKKLAKEGHDAIVNRALPNFEKEAYKPITDMIKGVLSGQRPDVTQGATHYKANYVHPGWAKRLPLHTDLGGAPGGRGPYHQFYGSKDKAAEAQKARFGVTFAADQPKTEPFKTTVDFTLPKETPTTTTSTTAPTTSTTAPKPGTGPFGGYNTLDELIQSTLPPPPPPPANYQEALAKYKQDYANWENSVRAWQMNDAAMNKGKVGPVPAMIMNNRPTPPNPADWGNPSGGEYRPEPPPPTSQLQPINQGAGTQVNPLINYPSPPPVTNPSPTPMPGTTGSIFTPQGTPTKVDWAPMQNMIGGSQLASQFSGANTASGGPGFAAPSGLPSYGGSTAGGSFGVSFMNKGGVVEDALRIARKAGGRSPAWTRKEGQNPEGGLNAKGRASAKAEGSNLKPPAPNPKTDKDAARRKSFCARMEGMKKKLTGSETAKDPDSRINKSLRAWNCADGGVIEDALRLAKGGRPIWDKSRPKSLGKSEPLSSKQKASAKAAAKAAGRPYPNLVDNMRAAQRKK